MQLDFPRTHLLKTTYWRRGVHGLTRNIKPYQIVTNLMYSSRALLPHVFF